jgi:hypothetical protein
MGTRSKPPRSPIGVRELAEKKGDPVRLVVKP